VNDRCGDLKWRIHTLTETLACEEVDLTEPANREAFHDVLNAFVPDGFDLVLVPSSATSCVVGQKS
jgi:hypothetical protein